MAFSRLVAFYAFAVALCENHTDCGDSECSFEESSLLQSIHSKDDALRADAQRAPFWVGEKGYSNCRNRQGHEFPCGENGKCCGDICANKKDVCCQNALGNDFACAGDGGGCCGNACYGNGSKCCRVGHPNEWYPVSKDTDCKAPRAPVWVGTKGWSNCRNRYGQEFPCGEHGKCCGDICANAKDVCCQNTLGNDFACAGDGGGCCGNACYAKGSKCCRVGPRNEWYPVSNETACKGQGAAPHKTCINRFGHKFWCSPESECCGDICVAKGGKCCTNVNGNNFACGKDSTCCGNACAGKGSKCCRPGGPRSGWYPVSEATKCLE